MSCEPLTHWQDEHVTNNDLTADYLCVSQPAAGEAEGGRRGGGVVLRKPKVQKQRWKEGNIILTQTFTLERKIRAHQMNYSLYVMFVYLFLNNLGVFNRKYLIYSVT